MFHLFYAICLTLLSAQMGRSALDTIDQYSCNFDAGNLCNWTHDVSMPLLWTISTKVTSSHYTDGPLKKSAENASYLYFNASSGRHGDRARITSPYIQGAHCMTFMYYMYGISMGRVVVYIKTNDTLRPVWIKSTNQFDKWWKAYVYLEGKEKYQVVIEAIVTIVTSHVAYKAAIDVLNFTKGQCQEISIRRVHVYYKMQTSHSSFKVDTIDFPYDDWTYDFSFNAKQTQTSSDEVLYFIHPEPVCSYEVVSKMFSTSDLKCIPIEFFYASQKKKSGQTKILLLQRMDGMLPDGIALEGDKRCCQDTIKGYFYANTTTLRLSSCLPGWHYVAPVCARLISTNNNWDNANAACRQRGGKLASPKTAKEFMNYFYSYFRPLALREASILSQRFLVGVAATDGHQWLWMNNQQPDPKYLLDNERNNSVGKCGVVFKDHTRNEWTLKAVWCHSRLSSFLCTRNARNWSQCRGGGWLMWFYPSRYCIKITVSKVKRTWYEANKICRKENGSLAVFSRKIIFHDSYLSFLLDVYAKLIVRHKNAEMFVGLKYVPKFRWTDDHDGEPVLKSLWFSGNPDLFASPNYKCAAMKFSALGLRLFQVNCKGADGLICQQDERNLAYKKTVRTQVSAAFGTPSLAVDGSYATCFETEKFSQPWLEVDLGKPFFIKKILITNRRDCCFQNNELQATLGRRGFTSQLCSIHTHVFLSKSTIFVCSQQLKARYVTIQALKMENLTLCEVAVTATESKEDFKGVFQEVWNDVTSVDNLRSDDRFPSHPETIARIKNFNTLLYNFIFYGQRVTTYVHRLTTYLQVPVSGQYKFNVVCNDVCELWIDNSTENTLNEGRTPNSLKEKILNLHSKYPNEQTSRPIFLSKCNLLKLEMFTRQVCSAGHKSASMQLLNGTFEGPIPTKRWFYVRPGYRKISFNLVGYRGNKITTGVSNQLIDVKASYEYCCHGAYCPVCPVKMYLQMDDDSFLVNESLSMNCNSNMFEFKLSPLRQPKSYPIKIRFSFVDEESNIEKDLTVGHLVIQAKPILQCNFTKDTCSWQNGDGNMNDQWNFTKRNEGYFLSASDLHKSAWLESDWIPNDEFTDVLGWCLSFHYILPSTSQLQVIFKKTSNLHGSVLWSLSGFQSQNWSIAQVSWRSKEHVKLIFFGKSFVAHGLGVGIDSITLVTSNCPQLPIHSEPGYKCKNDKEFQCANGQCINKDFVCDGDDFCTDGSDEFKCKCLLRHFSCSNGECIEASELCNGKEDCTDGSDESRCNKGRCPENFFQCVSGSCVPWSQTCDGEHQCDDGTDEPDICGFSLCPINDMSCSELDNVTFGVECTISNVRCNFEKGFCSLSHDAEGQFQWQIRSGSTPTKRTGPSFDHTTLNQTGKYIYIKASNKNPGDRALLLSGYLKAGEPVCIRFWYHMKGINIGALNIYSKRNISKQLLWSRSGNKGENWLYGQIGYRSSETFKILFEGTIGSGSLGDIALDDLSILYDNCTTIDHEVQLFCKFDKDTCGWKKSPIWMLSRFGNRPVLHDWQEGFGGYLYISAPVGLWGELISPVLSTNDNIVCITFWFYIYTGTKLGSEIRLSIKTENEIKILWMNSTDTPWQYSQIPLNNTSDFQLIFGGRKTTVRSLVLLDDITLSKESCDRIPNTEHVQVNSFFNNAEKYWKLDGTDKDLRSFGSMIYKEDSGRMAACFDGKTTHLETPAIDFHARSFSITCWVKVKNAGLMSHIYSDWSYPFQFRLYSYLGNMIVVLHGSDGVLISIKMRIPIDKWTFTGFSWNRQTREAALFIGKNRFRKIADKNIQNINLRVTNHTFYEIGLKKDSQQRFHGCLRDLAIFGYAISTGEMMRSRLSPSKTLCSIRQTQSGQCCVFPFIYNGRTFHNCHFISLTLRCSLTSNYDRDRKWDYCSADTECRTVENGWCGWQTVSNISNPWKRVEGRDMSKMKIEFDNMLNNINWTSTTTSKEGDYEVHFPKNHTDYINITNIPDMTSFTICMWLRTSDTSPGTPFIYRVRYEEPERHVLAIGLVDYTRLQIFVGEQRSRNTRWKLNFGHWVHVCLRWINKDGAIYLNTKSLPSNTSVVFAKDETIPGKGEFIIGVTSSYAKLVGEGVGQFVGDISDFNYWNWFLSDEDVNLRSTACGLKTIQPLISWELLNSSFVNNPVVRQPATCKEHEDNSRPLILLNLLNTNGKYSTPTTFFSPLFLSSFTHYGLCLRFVYHIYSPVHHELLVFQHLKVDNFAARLVWAVNESGRTNFWRFARASIAGVSSYKARTGNSPGYIAIKGIQVLNGYCSSKPAESHKVKSQRPISPNGYIQSPFFPGYYGPSSTYRWHITVDPQNLIRLHFVSFILEDHPECTKDYVSVYSMDLNTRIGKYCGMRHPSFVESTGNVMIIVFKSDSKVERQGFKLLYESRPGCPAGCRCSVISSTNTTWLVVKSLETSFLSTVPSDIPKEAKLLFLANNRICRVMKTDFMPSAGNLEYVDLSNNIITHIQDMAMGNLISLKVVRMNKNFLRSLPYEVFSRTNQLSTLDLGNNFLTTVEPSFLRLLTSLKVLSLRYNKISFLDERLFQGNSNLTALYLNFNQLEAIPELMFSPLHKLKILYLNDNKIKKFTLKMFSNLTSIEKLYLHNNNPLEFSPDIFPRLKNLKELQVDRFFLCCYAKKAIPDVKCISPKDFFSSCSDLMQNKTLHFFIWILGLSALLGNVFVVILRSIVKEDNKIHSFLLTNLAVADFLMGVYMLIIAIKDSEFQGEYFKNYLTWRTGNICKFAGGLSLLSSEVSVLLLTLITADRLKNIVFPFRYGKLNLKTACLIVAAIWIMGILLSVLPMANMSYFFDEKRRVDYYGRSALCLPLQLSRDKLAGWEYSVAIFIVLNLISFVFIAVAYIIIFITVHKSSRSVRSTSIKRESQMAKRMAFIIATDFCCWMPVIIIGILSLLDLFHDPEQQVYAWLAVFVLPVNSSINPVLYTFSTPIYKEAITKIRALFTSCKGPSTYCKETPPMQLKANISSRSRTSSKAGLKKRSNKVEEYANQRDSQIQSQLKKDETTFTNALIDESQPDKIQEGLPFGCSHIPEEILKVVAIPNFPNRQEPTEPTTGFLVVWSEREDCLQLIKYMPADHYSAWMNEARIASLLTKENPKNITKYYWHAKGNQVKIEIEENTHNLEDDSLFISYEYVSSVTLEDVLKDSKTYIPFDSLCAIVNDLLEALEELHHHSIVHGSICPGNILIKKGEKVLPSRVHLFGFSKSRVADQNNKEIQLGENIRQFGVILETLMKQYWIVNDEINGIIELCCDHANVTCPSEIKDIMLDRLNYQ